MINIVALGGGTGLSVILRGLKEVSSNITAIVTVADDGGGSGVLREDLGMLPPGDVRNCILALANKEPILQDLFQYRFKEGRLSGQNFGNLMIAAMVGISDNFESAIKKISDIFAITGEVFPVSEENLTLYARLCDGAMVAGESNIPYEAMKRKATIEHIWIEPSDAKTSDVVLDRIAKADVIVLGPGSLYTSIIPNLLIPDITRALNASKAQTFYISNLMTQPGETDGLTSGEHLRKLLMHSGLRKVDYLIANNARIPKPILQRYLKESSEQVLISDEDRLFLEENKIKLIENCFFEVVKGYVRHDAINISHEMLRHVERVYSH